MTDRHQLIQHLDQAREKLRSVVTRVDPKSDVYPPWTMKQVLAHITGWDDAVIASLRAHIAGDPPATPAVRGIDFYNAQTVEERQGLDYEHILREWEFSRQELKKIIQEMSQELYETPLVVPWGGRGTVAQIVEIFIEHEEEHAEEIRGVLGLDE